MTELPNLISPSRILMHGPVLDIAQGAAAHDLLRALMPPWMQNDAIGCFLQLGIKLAEGSLDPTERLDLNTRGKSS